MKRTKKTKKGFTLVELIVVLVILAILAAMLVPALTGYIRRARQEKDYQFAATVLTAAQSSATFQYSKATLTSSGKLANALSINQSTSTGRGVLVKDLVGDDSNASWTCSFSTNTDGVIVSGTVKINGNTYSWEDGAWNGNGN